MIYYASGARDASETLQSVARKYYDDGGGGGGGVDDAMSNGGVPCELIVIFLWSPVQGNWLALDQFVTAVEQNPCITSLSMQDGVFNPQRITMPTASTTSTITNFATSFERFFGGVLPSHRTLNTIIWKSCDIESEYVVMFATAFAACTIIKEEDSREEKQDYRNHHVWKLVCMYRTPIDLQGTAAIADNILRLNAPLETLLLDDCGIDSAGCQALFEALDGSTHLRKLDLNDNDITDITLKGVKALSNCTSLETLNLSRNALTNQTIQNLVEGLKTNFSLKFLHLYYPGYPLSSTLFQELLAKFNFTLHTIDIVTDRNALLRDDDDDDDFDDNDDGDDDGEDVKDNDEDVVMNDVNNNEEADVDVDVDGGDDNEENDFSSIRQAHQQRIQDMIENNGTVARAHEWLMKYPQPSYHVPHLYLWPMVLGLIHCKPLLIYRFVREANLIGFTNLQLGANSHSPHRLDRSR